MNSQQQAAALASIPEYPYRPLDESRNEIRVLTLLPADATSLDADDDNEDANVDPRRGLVHCEMRHVSLDARLPDYESFSSEVLRRPLSRRGTDEGWRSFSNERHHRGGGPAAGGSGSGGGGGGGGDGSTAAPPPPAAASSSSAPPPPGTPPTRVRSHSRYHRFSWGDYGALSYTWGDQADKVPVVLDGVEVFVGRNLEAALRALSEDPDYVGGGLRLWADAVCINQRDVDERSRQVKRMGDIFGGSLIVTIWLGDVTDEDGAPVAAETERGLGMLVQAVERCADEDAARQELDALLTDPTKKDAALDAIDVLVRKTYWSRVWIIQEKCLGPYNPFIVFGRHRFALMPLHRLLARANAVKGAVREREKVWRILKLVELVVANQERIGFGALAEDATAAQVADRRRRDLDDVGLLLMLGRLAGCKDERDKLYGLMGMIPDVVSRHITPDYAAPVERVFADFAQALVRGFDSLDMVLTGSTDTALGKTLPSWVPDLTDAWDPYLWGTSCAASGEDRAPIFRVEGADGGELVAQGFEVDVVDGAGPHLGWGPGGLAVLTPTDQADAAAPMPSDPRAAIARTLHRDAAYDTAAATTALDIPWLCSLDAAVEPRVGEMLAKGWGPVLGHANMVDLQQMRTRIQEQLRPWGREFRSFFPGGGADDEEEEEEGWAVPQCADPQAFVRALDKHIGIVYPVLTTARGRFGTSIRPVRKGDRIFVMLGCSAPVVLRPKKKKGEDGKEAEAFEVVSQCYVDGLMRGEALKLLEDGEAELKDVRLV